PPAPRCRRWWPDGSLAWRIRCGQRPIFAAVSLVEPGPRGGSWNDCGSLGADLAEDHTAARIGWKDEGASGHDDFLGHFRGTNGLSTRWQAVPQRGYMLAETKNAFHPNLK